MTLTPTYKMISVGVQCMYCAYRRGRKTTDRNKHLNDVILARETVEGLNTRLLADACAALIAA